jgi:hypothetical protein
MRSSHQRACPTSARPWSLGRLRAPRRCPGCLRLRTYPFLCRSGLELAQRGHRPRLFFAQPDDLARGLLFLAQQPLAQIRWASIAATAWREEASASSSWRREVVDKVVARYRSKK